MCHIVAAQDNVGKELGLGKPATHQASELGFSSLKEAGRHFVTRECFIGESTVTETKRPHSLNGKQNEPLSATGALYNWPCRKIFGQRRGRARELTLEAALIAIKQSTARENSK